jgi:LAO/AO transport system kinase
MLVCEAAGFDAILVETVGVGQSETAVVDLVDLFLVMVAPGAGDELQGIKRGIMELADLVVVNKADGDLAAEAERVASAYANALHLMRPKWRKWSPRVQTCSAIESRGITEIWAAVESFRDAIEGTGELVELRRRQAVAWMWSEVDEAVLQRFRGDPRVESVATEVEARVAEGTLSPASAARRLLGASG